MSTDVLQRLREGGFEALWRSWDEIGGHFLFRKNSNGTLNFGRHGDFISFVNLLSFAIVVGVLFIVFSVVCSYGVCSSKISVRKTAPFCRRNTLSKIGKNPCDFHMITKINAIQSMPIKIQIANTSSFRNGCEFHSAKSLIDKRKEVNFVDMLEFLKY